ncbi:MAG: DUF3298 domain-containing protein [Selenomonadaceae bacterium]|nr:DUF3298 domain-containing protein [Selenomonadaceae bacterium]
MRKIFFALIIFLMNFSAVHAAQIDSAKYKNNDDLIYPVVFVKNPEAAGKINSEIRRAVESFLVHVETTAADGLESSRAKEVSISFEVPCNHENGILSIILTEYFYLEGAAHPSTARRTLNFNSDSGERITADSLSEIAKEEYGESEYSPKNLTRKLKKYVEKNNLMLYSGFKQLTKIPEDFYFDNNLHVHFIFQQYEVAPYAVGIIEFDATTGK